MAVNTAVKRFAMMAFGVGGILPTPDGTIAAFDRATLLWLYGGIPLISPVVLGPYSCEAAEIFQAGAAAGDVFQAGQDKAATFQAGAAESEAY